MIHTRSVVDPEVEKYRQIWGHAEYFAHSPGLENVERFKRVLEPEPGESLIDIGCGTGIAGLEFAKFGLNVCWTDLIDDALKPEIDRHCFCKCPVWSSQWRSLRRATGWDYGFCCDVLEHIPAEFTMLAIERVVSACRMAWFQIAFEPDALGQLIGKPLHLTVQPFTWWRDRIATLGNLMDARDLCGVGLFVVNR